MMVQVGPTTLTSTYIALFVPPTRSIVDDEAQVMVGFRMCIEDCDAPINGLNTLHNKIMRSVGDVTSLYLYQLVA